MFTKKKKKAVKLCLDDNPLLPLVHFAANFVLYISEFEDESLIQAISAFTLFCKIFEVEMVIELIGATKMAKKLWTERVTIHIVQNNP